MSFETFQVGENDYQMIRLDAFRTNSYLMKMKGMLASAMGSGMSSNAANLMALIDEKTLNDIIFPLMRDCAVTCTTNQCKLQSASDMNKIFTGDTLDEFYMVVLEVLKLNFAPFICKMAQSLFGVDLEQRLSDVMGKMKKLGESNFGQTLTPNSGSGGQ